MFAYIIKIQIISKTYIISKYTGLQNYFDENGKRVLLVFCGNSYRAHKYKIIN